MKSSARTPATFGCQIGAECLNAGLTFALVEFVTLDEVIISSNGYGAVCTYEVDVLAFNLWSASFNLHTIEPLAGTFFRSLHQYGYVSGDGTVATLEVDGSLFSICTVLAVIVNHTASTKCFRYLVCSQAEGKYNGIIAVDNLTAHGDICYVNVLNRVVLGLTKSHLFRNASSRE